MSDQLAAFPLTFNWQIAKQTHEEPTGLDGQIAGFRLIVTDVAAASHAVSISYS